jgi:hypothetical protein
MKIETTLKVRMFVLVLFTGIFVSYARQIIQKHKYGWDSILGFVGHVFFNSFGIVGICTVAGIFITKYRSKFIEGFKEREYDINEMLFYGCIFIIAITAFVVFFLNGYHVGSADDYDSQGWFE